MNTYTNDYSVQLTIHIEYNKSQQNYVRITRDKMVEQRQYIKMWSEKYYIRSVE